MQILEPPTWTIEVRPFGHGTVSPLWLPAFQNIEHIDVLHFVYFSIIFDVSISAAQVDSSLSCFPGLDLLEFPGLIQTLRLILNETAVKKFTPPAKVEVNLSVPSSQTQQESDGKDVHLNFGSVAARYGLRSL